MKFKEIVSFQLLLIEIKTRNLNKTLLIFMKRLKNSFENQ